MRKAFAILLALAFLLSMAGMAFAKPITQRGIVNISYARKDLRVKQASAINNIGTTVSGSTTAVGNNSTTAVNQTAYAEGSNKGYAVVNSNVNDSSNGFAQAVSGNGNTSIISNNNINDQVIVN